MNRGVATFTLDHGRCPPWLFERMVNAGRAMTEVIIDEFGPDEYIARLGDPVWFQSLGTVLAFDWNASGLTTILTAALKEAIRGQERQLGVFICGGKGKTSRKTPQEIEQWSEGLGLPDGLGHNLVYNSKMSAKVDSALIQDGYQIYHHSFMFSRHGVWTVVQQGMNTGSQRARRYHWHSRDLKDLIVEPHSGIAAQAHHRQVLNLTAADSQTARQTSTDLITAKPERVIHDLKLLDKYLSPLGRMRKFAQGDDQLTLLELPGREFGRHPVEQENYGNSKYLQRILQRLHERSPNSYAELLASEGVGPKTIRALALVSEVIYGAKPSYQDPARYSFAHGGKDATPYPVDKPTYDQTIQTLRTLVDRARLPGDFKLKAQARLGGGV